MGCYRPIPAYQSGNKVKLWPAHVGKNSKGEQTPISPNLYLPCGQCIGCKTARANQWAHRCQHEASQWQQNIFLTLTYEDRFLPSYSYLDAKELQRFIKRLRKSYFSRTSCMESDKGLIRYFSCGEYGTQNGRPHYHLLLFNCNFSDRIKTRTDKRGEQQYTSQELQRLWPYGRHEFGVARPAAANYIAQYSLKKQRTAYFQTKENGYQGIYNISPDGEFLPKPAPFLRMSLKPGIGSHWLDKYETDLRHGYLIVNGKKFAIPRTYRERLKLQNPNLADEIQDNLDRHRRTLNPDNSTPERLAAGEVIHERRKTLMENRNL